MNPWDENRARGGYQGEISMGEIVAKRNNLSVLILNTV